MAAPRVSSEPSATTLPSTKKVGVLVTPAAMPPVMAARMAAKVAGSWTQALMSSRERPLTAMARSYHSLTGPKFRAVDCQR